MMENYTFSSRVHGRSRLMKGVRRMAGRCCIPMLQIEGDGERKKSGRNRRHGGEDGHGHKVNILQNW
jgi:hypothetical protein